MADVKIHVGWAALLVAVPLIVIAYLLGSAGNDSSEDGDSYSYEADSYLSVVEKYDYFPVETSAQRDAAIELGHEACDLASSGMSLTDTGRQLAPDLGPLREGNWAQLAVRWFCMEQLP